MTQFIVLQRAELKRCSRNGELVNLTFSHIMFTLFALVSNLEPVCIVFVLVTAALPPHTIGLRMIYLLYKHWNPCFLHIWGSIYGHDVICGTSSQKHFHRMKSQTRNRTNSLAQKAIMIADLTQLLTTHRDELDELCM